MGRKFSRSIGVHLSMAVALLAVASAWPSAVAAQKDRPSVKQQLEFGVDMARRGLWSEALFRFRQAQSLAPEKPEVYNNLAVAHEALGLFEEALELYRKGLSLAPRDKGLRNNYARFIDFYNRFRPDETEGSDGASVDGPTAEGLEGVEASGSAATSAQVEPPAEREDREVKSGLTLLGTSVSTEGPSTKRDYA